MKIDNFLDQVCILILEFSAIRLVPNNSKFQALPKGKIAVIQLGRCTIPKLQQGAIQSFLLQYKYFIDMSHLGCKGLKVIMSNPDTYLTAAHDGFLKIEGMYLLFFSI